MKKEFPRDTNTIVKLIMQWSVCKQSHVKSLARIEYLTLLFDWGFYSLMKSTSKTRQWNFNVNLFQRTKLFVLQIRLQGTPFLFLPSDCWIFVFTDGLVCWVVYPTYSLSQRLTVNDKELPFWDEDLTNLSWSERQI